MRFVFWACNGRYSFLPPYDYAIFPVSGKFFAQILKCFFSFQGIVHLLGEDRPSILQAVYELYDLEAVEPTTENTKQCRFIFIGKNCLARCLAQFTFFFCHRKGTNLVKNNLEKLLKRCCETT